MAATLHLRDYVREHWRDLKQGRPGHRFQERYRRARRTAHNGGFGLRALLILAALVAFAIGVVLVVFPGPAVPFFFVAGGLLASESRTIARVMDWAEVKLRAILAWGKRSWRTLPGAARVALLLFFACGSIGTTYLSLKLLRG